MLFDGREVITDDVCCSKVEWIFEYILAYLEAQLEPFYLGSLRTLFQGRLENEATLRERGLMLYPQEKVDLSFSLYAISLGTCAPTTPPAVGQLLMTSNWSGLEASAHATAVYVVPKSTPTTML